MSRTVPRFAPSVQRALLEPSGDVVVTLTPSARLRAARPALPTVLGETPLVDDRLVALCLLPDGRVRFDRTGFGVTPRSAYADAASLAGQERWVIRLVWDEDVLAVQVQPGP